MSNNAAEFKATVAMLVLLALGVFVFLGPQGCDRSFQSWRAEAYGSDWLVVQYNQAGQVMNYWELHNKSIASERRSDGIYFVDDSGSVVHLSGHYVFVQVAAGARKQALKRFCGVDVT